MAGRFTPAPSAIWRVLAPSYPWAAKRSSAVSRMRRRVSSPRAWTAGRLRLGCRVSIMAADLLRTSSDYIDRYTMSIDRYYFVACKYRLFFQGQRRLQHHPDRREAAAMVRRGPEPVERGQVVWASVADVGLPAVAGEGGRQPAHVTVARHLGDDRGGGDGIGARVAADDGLGAAAELGRHLVAVDQHQVRLLGHRLQRAAHGEESRLQDVDGVDLLDARFAHGIAHGAGLEDGGVGLLAFFQGQLLGIVDQPQKPALGERAVDDGDRRDHRAGQRAAPNLVDPGDQDRSGLGAALLVAKARHIP